MIVAFLVGLSAWLAKPWSWGMSLGFFISYTIWTLIEKIAFQIDRENLVFESTFAIFFLVVSIIILSSKSLRKYFHEQSSQD